MATVSEQAGIAVASEKRESAWDGGRDRGRVRRGMVVPRVFSVEGSNPFDQVEWDLRAAEIKDERGRAIFQQLDCEVPRTWSQLATNVVASKYFYGDVASGNGSPAEGKREYSVRQLVDRVTRTIADWGKADGYFATAEDAERFYRRVDLRCACNQYGSFNSPVWFNVGLFHQYGIRAGRATGAGTTRHAAWSTGRRTPYEYPQASACFIQSVSDDMEGIMRLATQRGHAVQVRLGHRHGPLDVAFAAAKSSRAAASRRARSASCGSTTQIASVVKSGGKTRRAAKMQTLKCWHPDILEFIECKTKEEKKAQSLIAAAATRPISTAKPTAR